MRYILASVLAFLLLPAKADNPLTGESCPSGSTVCARLTTAPYPETGIWYNSEKPGSGFVFEVQRGTVAGYYFGYGPDGEPVWYAISDTLELVKNDEVIWRLESDLLRFSGGPCINCVYHSPGEPTKVGEITVEFISRNLARFSVNDGPEQLIQTFTYGSVTQNIFPNSRYRLPLLNGPWVLYYIDRQVETETGGLTSSAVGTFPVWLFPLDADVSDGKIDYVIFRTYSVYESLAAGKFVCKIAEDGSGSMCKIDSSYIADQVFYMKPSDISDSYFKATAKDGDTIEGFRINYD